MRFDCQSTISRAAGWLKNVRFIIAAFVGVLALNGWLAFVHIHATPFVSPVHSSQIVQEAGNGFFVLIKIPFLYSVTNDSNDDNSASNLRLFENGIALGPPHSLHAQIRTEGHGRYSHWGDQLIFSASDSTDPRTNGRLYHFVVSTHVSALLYIPIFLIDLAILFLAAPHLSHWLDSRSTRFRLFLTSDARMSVRSKLFLAVIPVIGTFALALAIGTQYRTNDDVDMRMIAEGFVGDGTQTEFLLYQNIIVGTILKELYRLHSQVPWYDIELAACALLGAWLGLVGALRICKTRAEVWFMLIAGVSILIPIYRTFQFTASAMLLSGGAIVMFLSVWQARPSKKGHLLVTNILIVIVFFLGSLVRFHAAFLCLLALVPLVAVIRPRPAISFASFQMTTLLVATTISAAAYAYNLSYYARSPGWENFWGGASVRASAWLWTTVDSSRPEEMQNALSAAHWSLNDYALLKNWLYMDQILFSNDRVAAFADRVPLAPKLQRITDTYTSLARPDGRIYLFIVLCFVPILFGITLRSIVAAGAGFVWFAGVLFITGVLFKSDMTHILLPFYATCMLGCASVIFSQKTPRRRSSVLAPMVALVGVLYLTGLEIHQALANAALNEGTRRRVAYDLTAWPLQVGATVVVWDHNFPYEIWARPFHAIPRLPFRFLHTNDLSASPHSAVIYSSLGTQDMAWALCHIPGVVLVDDRLGYSELHAQMLETYMHEHYRETVKLDYVYDGRELALQMCRLQFGGMQ